MNALLFFSENSITVSKQWVSFLVLQRHPEIGEYLVPTFDPNKVIKYNFIIFVFFWSLGIANFWADRIFNGHHLTDLLSDW